MKEFISISKNVDGTEIVITKCLMLEDISHSLYNFLEENRHLEYVILKCEHHENRKILCDSKYGVCPGFYYKGSSETIINKLNSAKDRIYSDMF
ncbi:MAG: hypothetical protein HOK35_17055 [Cytophagia bacterium]|jgi:hypothetical protein|nr:hypothetical protein [Candidatus Neomarinimicrobiota bacterium]MBT5530864.1 hypothetical protein [Cytophagia bacterium]